jgi:hypothetical protein
MHPGSIDGSKVKQLELESFENFQGAGWFLESGDTELTKGVVF